MILSPFSNWVLQLFQIGPFWLLELAELLVVVGLILALTDKATTIGLITAITRALTGSNKNFSVGVSPGFARRAGIVLILIALPLSAAAIDGIASTPSLINYFGTGGPAFLSCLPPYQNLPCYGPGGANINATSCTAAPPSPCWTQVQKGFFSCTINTGQANCFNIIHFSPVYSVKPFVGYEFNGTVPIPTQAVSFTTTQIVPATLVFQSTNTTWINMPATDAELYGRNNQRLSWTVPTVYASESAYVCTDIVVSNGIPALTVQYSTDQTTWNYLGDVSFYAGNSGNLGFQCSPTETAGGGGLATLAQGTQYFFRVVGNDGFGPVNDAFGTIELFISGNEGGTTTLQIPVTCATTAVNLTPSQINIFAQCGNAPITNGPKIYTVNWWAGIPA